VGSISDCPLMGGGAVSSKLGAQLGNPYFPLHSVVGSSREVLTRPEQGTRAPRTPHLNRHDCQRIQFECVLTPATPQPRPDLMWQDAVCPSFSLGSFVGNHPALAASWGLMKQQPFTGTAYRGDTGCVLCVAMTPVVDRGGYSVSYGNADF
jgi:hypothetical protein